MTKKYTTVRKDIAVKVEIGHKITVQIPELELGNYIQRELRVVHVGMRGKVMNLLNKNDTIMYTVRVKSDTKYTIQSTGQLLENEITCNSGDHGIHVVMGHLSISCIERRIPVEVGDILKGISSDNDYEVRFVEGEVIVVKNPNTGSIYCHDEPTNATFNYKGLSYE